MPRVQDFGVEPNGQTDNTDTINEDCSRESMMERVSLGWNADTVRDLLFKVDQTNIQGFNKGDEVYDVTREILPNNGEKMEIVGRDEWTAGFYRHLIRGSKEYLNKSVQSGKLSEKYQSMYKNTINLINRSEQDGFFEINSFNKILKSSRYQELNKVVDLLTDQAGKFTHCRNRTRTGDILSSEDIECRLYMCPRTDKMLGLMRAVVAKCDKANRPFYFKFANDGRRNDRFIYYTTYARLADDIKMFSSIEQEHPAYFEGTGKNPFWGMIKDGPKGVYFGEEVKGGGKSYSELRSEAFGNAFTQWKKQNNLNERRSFRSSKEISDTQLEQFRILWRRARERLGISLTNTCFNK